MSVASVAVQFTIIDLLSRGVDRIKGRMNALSSATQETQRSFDRMNKSAKIAAGSAVATREMYKGLRKAVPVAADLQAELIGTKAELSGAGKTAAQLAREMAAVSKTAFSVQSWTPFDMAQIVALEKGLIKSGAAVDAVTAQNGAAAASAALAVYEGMEPLRTGKALIGIGTPFKIAASGYMGLADDISRAASASTVGAAEIAEGAKYAASPMANLGRSAREMLALSAVMAQVGVVGSQSGTSLKNFSNKAAEYKEFKDANGDLKKTTEIIEILRNNLNGMGDAEQTSLLKETFGEEGMPVAIALLNEGKGSYEDIVRAMENALPLQDKLNASMKGFGKQIESLRGTSKSTLATLYLPALKPLTVLVAKMNEFVALIGTAAQKGDGLGKAVSGISLGGVVMGGLATTAAAGASLFYGGKVLKGVGGVKGLLRGADTTAAGIAKGKAVEAATGVQPVFVTNWPAGGLGASSAAAGITAGQTGRISKLIARIPRGSSHLLGAGKGLSWMTKGLTVGAAGLGTTAAAVAGTAALSFGITTLINKLAGDPFGGLGAKLYDVTHRQEQQQLENNIQLNVRIDQDGRVQSDTGDMNTHINVARGRF